MLLQPPFLIFKISIIFQMFAIPAGSISPKVSNNLLVNRFGLGYIRQ